MRFFIGVKATEASEAGEMPGPELLRAMFEFNQELVAAGVMIDGNGLQPSAAGYKILTADGETRIVDGPFAETKELISGYWVLQANSMERPWRGPSAHRWMPMVEMLPWKSARSSERGLPENPDESDGAKPKRSCAKSGTPGSPSDAQGSLQPTPGKLVYMGMVHDR